MGKRADGEGSIGRRKRDGKYYGAVLIGGKRRWVYGDTRKEVVAKLATLKKQAAAGVHIGDAKAITVETFLDRWLTEVAKVRNKPRTYGGYENIAETHLKPALGKLKLADLRADHIQKLLNELSAAGRAPRTVRNVRAALRRALNQARRWRLIEHNPAELCEIPRIERHPVEPLTVEEAQTFLTFIRGHKNEVLYNLAVLLGLRQGELLGLLRKNVNLETYKLLIDGALHWIKGELIRVDSPKSASSFRQLLVPPTVRPMVVAHLKLQNERWPDSPYVFTSDKGGPLSPFTLVPQFKTLLKKAGIREVRFHDLRHSAASFLIARGEHPKVIMEVLGHSTIQITMDIYGHLFDGAKSSAIEGIDKLLRPDG